MNGVLFVSIKVWSKVELTGAMVHEIWSKNKLELTHLSQCQKGGND